MELKVPFGAGGEDGLDVGIHYMELKGVEDVQGTMGSGAADKNPLHGVERTPPMGALAGL